MGGGVTWTAAVARAGAELSRGGEQMAGGAAEILTKLEEAAALQREVESWLCWQQDAIESLRVRALSVQWGPLAHSTRILGHVGQLQRWEAVGGAALAPASSSFLRLCLGTDPARYYFS